MKCVCFISTVEVSLAWTPSLFHFVFNFWAFFFFCSECVSMISKNLEKMKNNEYFFPSYMYHSKLCIKSLNVHSCSIFLAGCFLSYKIFLYSLWFLSLWILFYLIWMLLNLFYFCSYLLAYILSILLFFSFFVYCSHLFKANFSFSLF